MVMEMFLRLDVVVDITSTHMMKSDRNKYKHIQITTSKTRDISVTSVYYINVNNLSCDILLVFQDVIIERKGSSVKGVF